MAKKRNETAKPRNDAPPAGKGAAKSTVSGPRKGPSGNDVRRAQDAGHGCARRGIPVQRRQAQ